MMKEECIIIGGSPAAYMCGIYLHIANISHLVIKTNSKTNFCFHGSDMVTGVRDVHTPEEFTGLVEKQAVCMGVSILNEDVVDISKEGDVFKISIENKIYETKSLVIDDEIAERKYRSLLGDHGAFYCGDKIPYKEAIIIAGAGCKIASDVKNFIRDAFE